METAKAIARFLIQNGAVLSEEDLAFLTSLPTDRLTALHETLKDLPRRDIEIVKNDIKSFSEYFSTHTQEEFYAHKTVLLSEHGMSFYDRYIELLLGRSATYDSYPEKRDAYIASRPDIEVVFTYKDHIKKREISDFVKLFSHRYDQISAILKGRIELSQALPIRRILEKDARERVSIIGMVTEVTRTKNDNIIIVVEDKTSQITCIAHTSKQEVIALAKDVVEDEVIGIRGQVSNKTIFIDDIIWPDVAYDKPIKYAPDDSGAIFISDIQYGRQFLTKEFEDFLSFLNQESEEASLNALAKSVRYLFVVGDLVDGVGIFPSQNDELDVKDINEQFVHVAAFLERVPKHIAIFIIAGNHDPVRLAEPQPIFPEDIAAPLYALPNVIVLSNPCIVRIAKTPKFSGIEVLLYHGYSYDHYAQTVDSIREAGGYDAPIEIMKFLLKRRHLAPTNTSTLYIPDTRKDYHVIESVPDIFASGHVHRMHVGSYRATTLLMCGCWMGKTKFEEKVGHTPEPGKAFHVDLRTRKTTLIDFITEERKKELQEMGWL